MSFVNPRNTSHDDHDERDQADQRRGCAACGGAIRASPSVLACWVPGRVADRRSGPRRNGSLPASHSCGWPGDAVFGYGFVCRWLSARRPVGRADDGPPSLFGPCGVGDDDEPLPRAVGVALAEQRGDVAEQQRDVVALGLRGRRGRPASASARCSASVVARRPRGTIGSSANVCSSSSSDASRRLNARRARQHLGARLERVGDRRRVRAQRGRAGLQLAEQQLGVAQERPLDRERRGSPASSAGTPPVIESWMYGRATSRRARNVMSRFTNSSACASAAGATIAAVRPSERKKRRRSVSGEERFWATGMMSRSSGRKAPIAVLIDSPRPANASPKPTCSRPPRRACRRRTC